MGLVTNTQTCHLNPEAGPFEVITPTLSQKINLVVRTLIRQNQWPLEGAKRI